MKIRNQLVFVLILILTTFSVVKAVNFVTLEYVNSNSEYQQTYESKLKKGYLTEEDSEELKGLKQAYINDSKARAERQNRFFGTLLTGMVIFLLLSYLLSKTFVIKGSTLIATLIVVVTAFVASSLSQSLFWGMFFYAGVWLGQIRKNTHHETS